MEKNKENTISGNVNIIPKIAPPHSGKKNKTLNWII